MDADTIPRQCQLLGGFFVLFPIAQKTMALAQKRKQEEIPAGRIQCSTRTDRWACISHVHCITVTRLLKERYGFETRLLDALVRTYFFRPCLIIKLA